jgi:hypothetical protein
VNVGCDDAGLPCSDGLFAATFALMTCWADAGAQRGLLARKIVSNLFFLSEHPGLSGPLRSVMGNAHARWQAIVDACDGAGDGDAGRPVPAVLH